MTKAKRLAMLEVASDLVQKIHHDLCRSKTPELAEKTLEIQRQMYVLSQALGKEEDVPCSSFEIPKKTLAAINAIGRKTHREV